MTTYPDREHCLETAINSILSQEVIDELVLNLSIEEYPNKKADLPSFLRSKSVSKKISINYLYGNTKAFKKLIPTLNQDKYKDCIVITCDDDCKYPDGIFVEALELYNGDRPVVFNVPNTYNWGNGRLSIYERKFFGDHLNLLERQAIWDTNNDDVAYGYLLMITGYKYIHHELASYDRIEMLDSAGDMHRKGMYNPYQDFETMRKYVLNRFGLSLGDLSQQLRNQALKNDTDDRKYNNINEIVEDNVTTEKY